MTKDQICKVTFIAEPEGLGAWAREVKVPLPVCGRNVRADDVVNAVLCRGWWIHRDDIVSVKVCKPVKTRSCEISFSVTMPNLHSLGIYTAYATVDVPVRGDTVNRFDVRKALIDRGWHDCEIGEILSAKTARRVCE